MKKRKIPVKKKRAQKKSEPYYVSLQDPKDVYKCFLECTHGYLTSLKQFEKVKKLSIQKKELSSEFIKLVTQIASAVNTLNKKLPKHKISTKKFEKTIAQPKPVVQKVNTSRAMSELEKLEHELAEIESKLGNL
ncbi:MAG: hypothetical protein ACMXYF_02995 [Candidatus Woesearchaeota archaeon]